LTRDKLNCILESARYGQPEDADFLGRQTIPIGGVAVLYCMTAPRYPSHGSGVGAENLHNLNQRIHQIPSATKQDGKKR